MDWTADSYRHFQITQKEEEFGECDVSYTVYIFYNLELSMKWEM